MYYALTVNVDQIITGVHESATPILAGTFAANPELADDTVVTIPTPADYQTYSHILCYNEDGTRKPLVWCIENGYMELPPNKEIINGELVDKEIPAEEQPQTIKQYLEEQFGAVRRETEKTTNAIKPLMTELVKGKPANIVISTNEFILDWVPDSYIVGDIRKDSTGYPKKCIIAHNSLTSPDHTIDVASLWVPFHATQPTYALPWVAPTHAEDIYKIGEWMIWIDGKKYEAIANTDRGPDVLPNNWRVEGTSENPSEPEPEEPEDLNSNGTIVWSEWQPWTSGLNSDLYQIGDKVTKDNVRYIATLGNNHYDPASGTGWEVVIE